MRALTWLPDQIDPNAIRAHLAEIVDRDYAAKANDDSLKTIYLFLTRKCNLGCQHCYIKGVGPGARDADFDLETIRGLIEQARPHGLRKVKVSGGEPMIHREFMDIMSYLGSIGLAELVLETNATLFKSDTVRELEQLPNLTVFVSLDHFDPEKHDEFRAKAGSYSKTAVALQEIGASRIQSVVTTTANRYNFDKVPAIIELVTSWGIDKHRTLMNIHPIGNARGHLDNALSLEECNALVQSVQATDAFKLGRAYLTLPPALMPLDNFKGVHTCGWGDNVLGILSTGQISMCSASYDDPEMIAGNALEEPLMDLWRHSPFFENLREIGAGRVKGVCANCIFYKVCRGVCKISSYSHYGEKDAPYPLCQEMYNAGLFPEYALADPEKPSAYRPGVIAHKRTGIKGTELFHFMKLAEQQQMAAK